MATKKSAVSKKEAPIDCQSLGIDLSSFDDLLPSTTVAQASKGLASDIRAALMNSSAWEGARQMHEEREAVELAFLFHKKPRQFRAWFERWKETPDYEFLRLLIHASNLEGVIRFQEENTSKTHARNREAVAKIPELWAAKKSAGQKKNGAAPEIARKLNLSPATVRKKLQGLP